MSVFNKIKNPNAGGAQIFLALLYIAVLGGLTVYALCCYLAQSQHAGVSGVTF